MADGPTTPVVHRVPNITSRRLLYSSSRRRVLKGSENYINAQDVFLGEAASSLPN